VKIIGTNARDYRDEEFICTVSRAELHRLVGYYYQRDAKEPVLAVGTTVDINKMFVMAHKALEVRQQLADSAKVLRACAELVDGQADVVKTPPEDTSP
jgi:hypothetical protein